MAGGEVATLVRAMRSEYLALKNKPVISNPSEEGLLHVTSKTRSQVNVMKEKVEREGMKINDESLITYLTYLWTGMLQTLIGAIYGVSQQNVCKQITSAREKLIESFVPWYLGNSQGLVMQSSPIP